MTEKDEIAELRREAAAQKARIEELERKAKPPEPFNPGDYQPIDWTARMSMPLSTVREMAQAIQPTCSTTSQCVTTEPRLAPVAQSQVRNS